MYGVHLAELLEALAGSGDDSLTSSDSKTASSPTVRMEWALEHFECAEKLVKTAGASSRLRWWKKGRA